MTTTFDPKMMEKFREEVDTYLLVLQQDLISIEREPQNVDYLREAMRAAHTIKGASSIMGFRQIAGVMHEVESVMVAIQQHEITLSLDLSDLLFEAIDAVDNLTKGVVKNQPVTIDTERLVLRLQGVLVGSSGDSNGSSNGQADPSSGLPPELPVVLPLPGVGLPSESVRVRVERLDSLMNVASEMVISRMQNEQAVEELRRLLTAMRLRRQQLGRLREKVEREWSSLSQYEIEAEMEAVDAFDEALDELGSSTLRGFEEFNATLGTVSEELQDTVLSIRMLPIETIFGQYQRNARDLARERGKQINLVTIGGETEVDKKVLESLNEALIHLVRNAIDHGIEPGEERLRLGKLPMGMVTMRAYQQGGQVVVDVSDDGAGIDATLLKATAVRRGLLTAAAAENLSDAEAQQLIFQPGFSTARLITDSSGRGVGMDSVRTAIARLGGSITLDTKVGAGTTVSLRLPLTLTAIRALLFAARNQVFAIATSSLETLEYIGAEDLILLEGREAVQVRGRTLPLLRLEDLLDLSRAERSEHLNQQQYEIAASYRRSQTNGEKGEEEGGANAALVAARRRSNDLLAANSATYMDESSQYTSAYIRTLGIQVEDRLPILVVSNGDRQVAFLVEQLLDERDVVVKNLGPLFSKVERVSGATILGDGSIVVILDGPSLVNAARAQSRRQVSDSSVAASLRREEKLGLHILIVDDSVTTRELERSILEAAGYRVDIATDGEEALNTLAQHSYALIIADIEMPRMDGFTLTRNIKADPRLRDTPVIIVSSLASEDYKRRGIEVGAQAYITKGQFDQGNLLDTIELLANH